MSSNSSEPARAPGKYRIGPYRLEELIALSAFLVSLASIAIAYEESRATKQLVLANSLPYLSLSSTFDRGADLRTTAVTRTIENDGVGPADIRNVSMVFDEHEYADPAALLRACCGITRPHTIASLNDRMLRPGKAVDFLVLEPNAVDRAGIERYAELLQAGRIETTVCYCSVFSECWVLRTAETRPTPAKVCREHSRPSSATASIGSRS